MTESQYRVVRDNYAGFEVQIKRWWLPIWLQIGGRYTAITNTHGSLEAAEKYAEEYASGVRRGREIKYLGSLPKSGKKSTEPTN